MTTRPLLVDWRDGRITLAEPGASVPLQVHRILRIQVGKDGFERFDVRYGLETNLGSCTLRLGRGLREIALDASIDEAGVLELQVRELLDDWSGRSVDPFGGEFLAILRKEAEKGRPWIDEHVVAELLGIPTRREMVLDDTWLRARDALLEMKVIQRRVHREEVARGYIERRQLAMSDDALPLRHATQAETLTSVVELARELAPAASSVERSPSAAPTADGEARIRSAVFWMVLGALVLYALVRAWS